MHFLNIILSSTLTAINTNVGRKRSFLKTKLNANWIDYFCNLCYYSIIQNGTTRKSVLSI
jgi:hypothetical protein